MAVTEEFREAWLECEEEYGKNIEAGDMPVIGYDEVDETISLPAVKFTAPYNPGGANVFDSYAHVPMRTFKKKIDDLAGEVSEATSDLVEVKQATIEATDAAIDAAEASRTATEDAENVNANLTGMTVTITDRNGVSRSVNIGFEIDPSHVYTSKQAMIDDAANIRAGQFCMIATSDPTATDNATLWSRNAQPASAGIGAFTFLSDLDQASSAAFADWLENYKPTIEADHTRAVNDHTTAVNDHTTAGSDHQTATTDHGVATQDHQTSTSDHQQYVLDTQRAGQDHQTSTADHQQYVSDTERAGQDHQTSTSDHQQYVSDTERAGQDHQTSTSDHQQYESDTQRAGRDHQTATADHLNAVDATAFANREGNRAKAFNDNPWEIGDDGFIYVWDETHDNGDGTYGAMVRTNKMIIDFEDLTPEQQASMVQEFLTHLTFDETPTSGSTNPVTSRGIKSALDTKQDTLTYATIAESEAAAGELT